MPQKRWNCKYPSPSAMLAAARQFTYFYSAAGLEHRIAIQHFLCLCQVRGLYPDVTDQRAADVGCFQ